MWVRSRPTLCVHPARTARPSLLPLIGYGKAGLEGATLCYSSRRAERQPERWAAGVLTCAGRSKRKVNRNFSIITLDMICGGLYNGPACKETVKDAESQGGEVASRSESPRRPAEECKELAPNAERNWTWNVGKTSADGGTLPTTVRLASA
jgi:hypothetical protein